jgi:cytochrome P450 family 135
MPGSEELPPGPRVPGPVLTLWYTFDQPGLFAGARRRFGDTWTLRLPGFPPIVITRDRDAIARLFTGDPLRLWHGNEVLRPLFGARSLLLLDPAEHLARRRLELPAFHGQAIGAYAERIRELTHEEVSSWPESENVASHRRTRVLTLTIILELVLGVRDVALRAELGRIFDSFDTPLNNLGMFAPPALIRRSRWNLPVKSFYSQMDRLRELLSRHIARTRTDPHLTERHDVLALLVQARGEDGATLTDDDLRDELATLVMAGHETTAAAMAWACDLLAHNPSVAARLRQTLAGGERDYLKATAKEVLRARTAVYVSAGRRPIEPLPVGRWLLGPDVLLLVDAQGVHSDPRHHREPLAFKPERFLQHTPPPYAYLPFGGGAHRCLGASLAMLELELFLEAVAGTVELTPTGPPARPTRRGITLVPANQGRIRSVPVPALASPAAA